MGTEAEGQGAWGRGLPSWREASRLWLERHTPCLLCEHLPGVTAGEKLCPRPWGWPGLSPTHPCFLPSLSFPAQLSKWKSEQPADVGGLPGIAKFIL